VLQTIHVDARGAVMNDQFAQMILNKSAQYSRTYAQAMGAETARQTLKAVRGRMRQRDEG
jgi:hypothetical protein